MKIKRLKMGYIVMTVFYSLSILLYGVFNLKNYFEPPYDPSTPKTFDLLQTMYEGGLYAYLFVILSVIAILSATVYKNFKNKRAQRVFLFGYVSKDVVKGEFEIWTSSLDFLLNLLSGVKMRKTYKWA